MGLVTGLLILPLAPVRGVAWIAEQVQHQAEQEYYDPAAIRRQLDDLADAHAAGDLTDNEYAELEDALVGRLIASHTQGDADGG